MQANVTTPNCAGKGPTAQQAWPLGTEPNRPILVELDDTSNHSGDNHAPVQGQIATPDSHVMRVHAQPRLRVVPCAKKLLAVAATTPSGETSADVSHPPTTMKRRYKDPPGYSDARDFGVTEEPFMKPPLLQPKNHGVSRHLTPRHDSGGCS